MSIKSSPPPWVWWDESTGRPPKYDLMHLTASNGNRVLGCYGGAGFLALGKSDEQIANAHLIAAAPELLFALKAYIEFFERYVNTSTTYLAIKKQGDEALRKALETR